jgi:hypothetical protein
MKAYSPGVGSQWAVAQPVRSNRLHSIQLWISICLRNGDTDRIALYADDMAAGVNTLEELFEIYKALVKTLAKAGIQIKSSKVEFDVEEITFHNYRIIGGTGPMANTTTPKDENLDPIKSCGIPQTVTQLKA